MNNETIKVCMNEEELVDALYSNEDMIYIEASLGRKIANIKKQRKKPAEASFSLYLFNFLDVGQL